MHFTRAKVSLLAGSALALGFAPASRSAR